MLDGISMTERKSIALYEALTEYVDAVRQDVYEQMMAYEPEVEYVDKC